MDVYSSAPARIDLAGGTLDIWPLYLYHDGAQTVNAAISLRAGCRIACRTDSLMRIVSEDTGTSIEAADWADLVTHPESRLLGFILRFFGARGLDIVTRSDSPVGAGIAGSSALNIAACGAVACWTGTSWTPEELIQIAMNVEAQTIGVPTGAQDYRPALYGGISTVSLGVSGVHRIPLPVDPRQLESRLVLAYTGASRNSGINNWEIVRRHLDGDHLVFDHLERIRDVAARLREALVREDWPEVGHQIAAEWESRKQLAPGVTTPEIDNLITRAMRAGARAAKVCGAGGGGCLFCFTDPPNADAVRQALVEGGARVLPFRIESEGLRVEQVAESVAQAE